MIIGSGKGTKDFKKQIEKFINKVSPIVLELNFNGNLDQKLVNYHVYTNPQRFFGELDKLIKSEASVIIPSKITTLQEGVDIHNYEFKISSENKFKFNNKYSELPNSLALAYALALSLFSKNDEIFITGFDGYEDTARNFKVNETFNKFESSFKKNVTSITPTKYMVSQKSIFPLI